jgi:tetratricopeptide (TPR) repeat protein
MPDFADAHFSLSLVYVNLSKYQEAVYALKQAIKIKSDSAEKHQELGHDY